MSDEQHSEIGAARRHSGQRWWLGSGAALVGFVVLGVWLHQPAEAQGRRRLNNGGGPVAVRTARAKRSDVPIYLQGLGTVQAFYTATMASRVDGQLQSVHFDEGQLVKKGQLLAKIDPRPYQAALDQATANRQKDAAQLESAKTDLGRYEQLLPQNLASKQQVDDQRAQVAQLTAQVQIDQAAIDNARTQLDYTNIAAPFDGRTGIRLVDPGNNVHASDTTGIVVVTQMQPISVVFTLPEGMLEQVQQAEAKGTVSVTAIAQDGKTVLDNGKLTVVDNQIDATTGTMRLKAVFPNVHNKLWPGQFVNARVLTAQQHDVITIPTEAVQTGPDGPFAYVVNSDTTVEARPLQLGEQSGDMTVVLSGLSEGERVVTTNQFRLEPGAKVSTS
jgi:multidrug efflux system membrane fusion protein